MRMAAKEAVREKIIGLGIPQADADAIADCIVAKKSCSWVNNEEIDQETVQKLGEFLKENEYKVSVNVQEIPTRSKYIWEVKAFQ